MATAAEIHALEPIARKRAMSSVTGYVHNHRTLCVGMLYAITIVAVLACVARL